MTVGKSPQPNASSSAMSRLIDGLTITRRHDECLKDPCWPDHPPLGSEEEIGYWIDTNHRCNTQLWHQEDLARRTRASDAEIVANKRAIDHHNQQRNDAIEKLNELLLVALGWMHPAEQAGMALQLTLPQGARLNSETVGSMIDRLSILALKIKAMKQLVDSENFREETRQLHAQKLHQLQAQRNDLSLCLDAFWSEAVAGRACFKVYRQYKLYNDPSTNPALMAERMQAGL